MIHRAGFVWVIWRSFTDLKAAIDTMDMPPIERLESEIDIAPEDGYTWETIYVYGDKIKDSIQRDTYDILSRLVGKPLPIYEKGGTWRQIGVEGDGQKAEPISIWRYTK